MLCAEEIGGPLGTYRPHHGSGGDMSHDTRGTARVARVTESGTARGKRREVLRAETAGVAELPTDVHAHSVAPQFAQHPGLHPGRDLHHAVHLRFIQHLRVAVQRGEQLPIAQRSEEHTSELQSQSNLVCRLLLEKKKKHKDKVLMEMQL